MLSPNPYNSSQEPPMNLLEEKTEILKSLEPAAPTPPETEPHIKQESEQVLAPVVDEKISTEPPSALEEKLHHISTQLEASEMSEVLLTPLFHECLSVVILSEKERRLLFSVGSALIARLSDKKEFSLAASLVRQLMSKEGGTDHASTYQAFCRRALDSMSNRSLSPQEMKESLEYHDLLKLIPAEQKEISFAASVVAPEVTVNIEKNVPRSTRLHLTKPVRYGLVCLLLIASCMLWFIYGGSSKGDLADSFRESTQSTLVSTLDTERDEVSNLEALLYNVQEDEQRVAATALPEQVLPTPRPTPMLPQPRVTIDTNGPYEPRKVEEILDGKRGSVYERLPQQQEPSLRDDDSRGPRPLADRDPPSRPGRFETGVRYEVMINTSVFDRPSFNAKEVEELMVGDRVRVEARLGRWLKIRSRNGEPGYIMAQDAQKLFD